ncbi:hypothetical protein KAJ89_02940 [Candidatus Parcubacteria bacterium]|nr:hypothetical protein [Candidatus Parcubacteria bacterium]
MTTKKENENKQEVEFDENVKELVKLRLCSMPEDVSMSIGSEGQFTRDELIAHIEKGDEIGNKVIKIEIEFLKSFKKGDFYESEIISDQAVA